MVRSQILVVEKESASWARGAFADWSPEKSKSSSIRRYSGDTIPHCRQSSCGDGRGFTGFRPICGAPYCSTVVKTP